MPKKITILNLFIMKKLFTQFGTLACLLLISGTILGQSLNSMQSNENSFSYPMKDYGYLTYFNTAPETNNCLGADSIPLMMLNRFTNSELSAFDGQSLIAVSFLMADLEQAPTTGLHDVAVYVYQGGTYNGTYATNVSGTLVKQQSFQGSITFDSLNTIVFDAPVIIDAQQELWIGISATVWSGYPLVADSVTDYNDKGNLAGMQSGGTWYIGNVNEFMGGGTFDGDFAVIGFVSSEVGISTLSLSDNNIAIYPNPAKDVVTLSGVENSTITIFDVTGKMMEQLQSVSPTQTINVANYSEGLYLIQIMNGNNISTKKLNIVR